MKYDISRAVMRNREFILNTDKPGALVVTESFGKVELPGVKPLEAYDLPGGLTAYLDDLISYYAHFYEAHAELDDDWLPALKPRLGIAEHSCFLGGDVTIGANTSYHHPAIDDIMKWRDLKLSADYPHYRMLLDGMAYLHDKVRQYGFFTCFRGADGPMDIANAVRGNDLLYDFIDEPEETKAFLDFCADAAKWNFEQQRPFVSEIEGGFIGGMGAWLPGHSAGHLSEDASCLISPKMYEEFGLPATQKLLRSYDFSFLHVHSLGRACIPIFARMEKLGVFQLSGDPNQPTAMDVYREYADVLRGRAVMLDLSAAEVKEHFGFLKDKRTIVNLSADSIDEANAAIELLRTI